MFWYGVHNNNDNDHATLPKNNKIPVCRPVQAHDMCLNNVTLFKEEQIQMRKTELEMFYSNIQVSLFQELGRIPEFFVA